MSILIVALLMAIAMIVATSHALFVERRKEMFRVLKSAHRGHFENNFEAEA